MGKDSANERHESLLSDGRVQPILCKDKAFLLYMQKNRQEKWRLWVDMGCFCKFYHYKVSLFCIFVVSLESQIENQSEIELKLNFNNLIMED